MDLAPLKLNEYGIDFFWEFLDLKSKNQFQMDERFCKQKDFVEYMSEWLTSSFDNYKSNDSSCDFPIVLRNWSKVME